jgi:hypothetical protein
MEEGEGEAITRGKKGRRESGERKYIEIFRDGSFQEK